MEKEQIQQTWNGNIREFFYNNTAEKPIMHKSMKGPRIFKSELRSVLSEMKRNKAADPDEIVRDTVSIR